MKRIRQLLFITASLLISITSYSVDWDTMGINDHSCYNNNDSECNIVVKTRYGAVNIVKDNTKVENLVYKLLINGKVIKTFEDAASITIEATYPIAANDNVLISVGSGGAACPMELYIVQVDANATYPVSPSFGTCSDYYKAHVDKDALIITLPEYGPLDTSELSEKEIKALENPKDVIYRWVNSQLSQQ